MKTEPFRWHPSFTWAAHLFKAVTQQHHRALQPLFARFLGPDAVIFDVGAHAGQFAKLFAATAPKGRVYAFEPGSYARSVLRCVLWLHRIRNVSVVPLGLGSEPGLAVLHLPIKRRGSYGFGLAHLGTPEGRWQRMAEETVGVTTIDAFMAAQNLTRLDFIKADIEGWEVAMLRGGVATLTRYRPVLLLELHEGQLARAGDSLEAAFSVLTGLGYRPYLGGPDNTLIPVESPSTNDIWWLPEA